MEFTTAFKTLVSSIEPSAQHVAAAKAAHEKVRDQLRTDQDFKDAHKDTFLAGSYARHTAINDINDVDVICLIDIDISTTAADLVLAWTQSVLDKYYTETKRQGRSIGVLAARGVWLDIVPATPSLGDEDPLWIPDREAKQWVATHPKGQIQTARDKNKLTAGLYVQVVKLLKFWRDRLPTESSRPKSYILESLVHGNIGLPPSHASGVVSALEGIERNYGWYRDLNKVPTISDPAYSMINIAKRWDLKEFKDFMNQARGAAETARKALDSTDEGESRGLWRRLFGSTFGQ